MKKKIKKRKHDNNLSHLTLTFVKSGQIENISGELLANTTIITVDHTRKLKKIIIQSALHYERVVYRIDLTTRSVYDNYRKLIIRILVFNEMYSDAGKQSRELQAIKMTNTDRKKKK